MNPITIIIGLVVALLTAIWLLSGMSLAWALVMFLAAAVVGLIVFIVWFVISLAPKF